MVDETSDGIEETPGVFIRIPLGDGTLAEAKGLVEDASWFEKTRMAILFHFPQVSLDDYWNLSVSDHTAMCMFLKRRGLLDG